MVLEWNARHPCSLDIFLGWVSSKKDCFFFVIFPVLYLSHIYFILLFDTPTAKQFNKINCRAVLLAVIVEKSKKCLDFAFTLFLIHLMICTFYNGLPRTFDWWIVNILGTIIMVLLGEYVCSIREMSDIPLLQI